MNIGITIGHKEVKLFHSCALIFSNINTEMTNRCMFFFFFTFPSVKLVTFQLKLERTRIGDGADVQIYIHDVGNSCHVLRSMRDMASTLGEIF